MRDIVLVHYHEINLKGNNRGWFESRLLRHLNHVLADLISRPVEVFGGRMLVPLDPETPAEALARRMRGAFGIANFAFAQEIPAEMDGIRSAVSAMADSVRFTNFRVEARRATKNFPFNSQQMNMELGAMVKERTGAAVRLGDPEVTFYVEIVGSRAFLYREKLPGGGGLPSRTGGKVLTLLSGGIDSPVAAYRMMRRGCLAHFVHFHSFPHTTIESQDKVRRLVGILARYQLDSRLHLVPFAAVQREIVAYTAPPLRVVLYRRFMMRIAEAIAQRERAQALVTGDSLGQVASQTLENLRAVSAVTSLPVFRPLIGDDKEDIIRIARMIDTYEVSIQPDEDCCTMFVPRHPETMAKLEQVLKAEEALDVQRLVESALAEGVRETIPPDFAVAAQRS